MLREFFRKIIPQFSQTPEVKSRTFWLVEEWRHGHQAARDYILHLEQRRDFLNQLLPLEFIPGCPAKFGIFTAGVALQQERYLAPKLSSKTVVFYLKKSGMGDVYFIRHLR